jgi:hypothetical protein
MVTDSSCGKLPDKHTSPDGKRRTLVLTYRRDELVARILETA